MLKQAIFILKDEAVGKGVTEEKLLKEAQQVLHSANRPRSKGKIYLFGPVWACGGAVVTGLVWLLTVLL